MVTLVFVNGVQQAWLLYDATRIHLIITGHAFEEHHLSAWFFNLNKTKCYLEQLHNVFITNAYVSV